MQERTGLDCINYLTDVNIRANAADPREGESSARQFLEKQIEFKRRELNDLQLRLRDLDETVADTRRPGFILRLLGRSE